MNIAIIYESVTGNTREIAQEIKKGCNEYHSVQLLSVEEALKSPLNHHEIDLYFLGSWTNKGYCGDYMKAFVKQLDQATVALFQTAGYGNSTEYYHALEKRFIEVLPENTRVLGAFCCQGRMTISVRNRIVSLLKSQPQDAKLRLDIQNFDSALSHPDQHDYAFAQLFAEKILQRY